MKFDYEKLKEARQKHSKFWILQHLEDGYKKPPPVNGDSLDLALQDQHIKSIVKEDING